MLRLDDGESGELIQALTAQTLTYIGAPNAADSTPTYSSTLMIANNDSLTTALGKIDAAAARKGATETITGAWTFSTNVTVGAGITIDGIDVGSHNHSGGSNGSTLDAGVIATGTLPVARGGTGTTTSTGTAGSVVLSNSPTIVTPTIASFANSNHNHQNSAGGGQLDHGAALTGLGDDDHTQYSLVSGTRAFTGKVAGVSTSGGDGGTTLATKDYVDSVTGTDEREVASWWIAINNNGSGGGSVTTYNSYNVTSLSGPAVGASGNPEYGIDFTPTFSAADDWVCFCTADAENNTAGYNQVIADWLTKTTGTVQVQTADDTGNTNPIFDLDVIAFGET